MRAPPAGGDFKQVANFILLHVAYQHCLNMNTRRGVVWRAGFTRARFLRMIADRLGVPFRWHPTTAFEILSYLDKQLTPRRLALPVGYSLRDIPRWSSAPETQNPFEK